jgi:hypothetical protein
MDVFCNTWVSTGTSSITVNGAVGDTFTSVKGNTSSNCAFQTFTITGATGIVNTSSATIGYPSATTFTIVGPGTFTVNGSFTTLTITVVANAPVASAGTSATPSDLLQSIELGSASSCASVSRPDLDWSGVSSGNWTQSWAMWPNAGKGGPVCNRVLWFNSGVSRWSSAAR